MCAVAPASHKRGSERDREMKKRKEREKDTCIYTRKYATHCTLYEKVGIKRDIIKRPNCVLSLSLLLCHLHPKPTVGVRPWSMRFSGRFTSELDMCCLHSCVRNTYARIFLLYNSVCWVWIFLSVPVPVQNWFVPTIPRGDWICRALSLAFSHFYVASTTYISKLCIYCVYKIKATKNVELKQFCVYFHETGNLTAVKYSREG